LRDPGIRSRRDSETEGEVSENNAQYVAIIAGRALRIEGLKEENKRPQLLLAGR
jgi:hypothetical protein